MCRFYLKSFILPLINKIIHINAMPMRGTKNMLKEGIEGGIPKPKCKFHRYCPLYRNDSYTCNSGGGNYCGMYRDLQCRGTFGHIIPLSLILLTISLVLFVFSILYLFVLSN